MEITRQDLYTLKDDLLRELGGRLDRIENRLKDGDRRIESHEVRLAVLKLQAEDIEPRVEKLESGGPTNGMAVGEWPWKAIVGLVTLLTLLTQGLVRIAEALAARL